VRIFLIVIHFEYFFRSVEMCDVVKFVFYYGPGTVQTNEMGADLSDFQYIEVPLTAPQTWYVS
jgi:hypothetical protein